MRTPVDQATRDLVTRDGLGRTLFVEAGAGTGKTSQLVGRITNLVLTEGVPLGDIAAVTFTEAAASELQTRIRVAFERRAAESSDPAEQARCRAALAEADRAAISTVHGFASRLLGEFAVDAGLPPKVRVLDEVSSQLAHEDRWQRFVDGLYDDPANEAVLVRATLLGVAFEPQYQGHATLKDVAAELAQNWDRLDDLAGAAPAVMRPVDFGPFDRAVREISALPNRCSDPDDLFHRHLVATLIPEMSAIAGIGDANRKLRHIAGRTAWTKGTGGRKDAWGGDVKGAKDAVDVVNEAVARVKESVINDVLQHLLVLIAQHVLGAARGRQADGGLEFHDLLVLARELLRRNEAARASLHQRFSHILIDEFQDTDPIQIDLATLIAASITGPESRAWSALPVDDGRLFFVGDPKQSIYRFRRADIELFLNARDRFGADGAMVRLSTNFRTVGPILDWVNAFFAAAMPVERPGKQPKYEPLAAWRSPALGADHRPVLLGGQHPNEKVKAAELREAEAADVAAAIVDIATRPDAWPVQDLQTDNWRPARLSDVTILVPTRTSLPYLREALTRANVPYRLATGTLVYATQEVRDALAALRAIDDPTDELSLVAALRSPLYACSDVDLFTFRSQGGRWDLRNEPPTAVPGDHPVRAALTHLHGLWEERWWLTPSTLVERLLRERQADLLAFGAPRPPEVWRRLRFLIDQAREFEEAGGSGIRAFLAWADLQGADGARVHEPLLPETDDDAVQILTIHGAKGLEFPITILSGLTTKPGGNRSGVSVLWGDSGQVEVKLRKGVATANHEPRADLEVEMDVHERLRLLYVAATRARDHLVVSCHHKADGGLDTYAGLVFSYFESQPALCRRVDPPVSGAVAPAPARPVSDLDDDRSAWIAAREALLAPQRAPRVVSATAVARAGDATRHDEGVDKFDEFEEPEAGAAVVRRRGRAGSTIGRAVHATLQIVDLQSPQQLDDVIRAQCDIESIPESTATVTSLVRSALSSSAVRQAAAGPHHKELYVAAPMGDRVIEGYIDLLAETPDGLVVIDYKTDSAGSESDIDAHLAAYELQGAAYAVALEAAVGQPVIDCKFVFCKRSGPIERSVRDLEAAKARVRASQGG